MNGMMKGVVQTCIQAEMLKPAVEMLKAERVTKRALINAFGITEAEAIEQITIFLKMVQEAGEKANEKTDQLNQILKGGTK